MILPQAEMSALKNIAADQLKFDYLVQKQPIQYDSYIVT